MSSRTGVQRDAAAVTINPLIALRRLLAEVAQLGITFSLSGAAVLIHGLDALPAPLQAALERHQQSGLLWAYLGGDTHDGPAIAFAQQLDVDVNLVSTRASAKAGVRRLIRDMREHGGYLAIDVETAPLPGQGVPRPCVKLKQDGGMHAVQPKPDDPTPLDPHQSDIAVLQLYAGGAACFLFRGDAIRLVAGSRWLRRQHLVAHNAGFELAFLRRHTPLPAKVRRRSGRLECSMQETGLLLGVGHGGSGRSLTRAAEAFLGLTVPKELATSDWSAERLSPGQVAYAASDAVVTWRLWPILAGRLHQTDRWRAYQLQRDAIPAVTAMEWRGLGFDPAEHARQVERWSRELAAARQQYHASTGQHPPSTTAQIRAWLRSVLPADQLAAWPRTKKTSELSTKTEHLKRLVVDVPSARPVLAMLAMEKLISSFGPTLAAKINPVTGRLHCRFNIAGAKSGRFSSNSPNPQQLPSQRAPEFRRCIVAEPGNVLAVCDWSQIELRAAAWISGDRALTELYRRGGDLHRENAAAIAGVPLDAVTPEQRQAAKPVSFGAIYGIGPRSLAEDAFANYGVNLSEADARDALDTFFRRFRRLDQWRSDNADRCRAQGFVRIGAGRVVEAAWEDYGQLSFPQCCNLPIQGICADAMLRAIPLAHAGLLAARIRGGLVATIHDELLAEVAKADGEQARAILQDAMIVAFETTFPGAPSNGVAVATLGPTWAEAKD